ncbi:MAG TPA: TetR family transcriptional regulator [Pseudolysinimonas sp.]|jgi:AcrR family transcriptional regulator
MSLLAEDRTSRAVLRDEALRLFAERGADAVTLREVAAAAGVSAALVIRHYGSKEGLQAAVDDHVVATLERVLGELADPASGSPFDPNAAPGIIDAIFGRLPAGSALPRYLGRMLLDGGPAASSVFRRLSEVASDVLDGLVRQGLASPGADPSVRATILLTNDLAVFMLRDRIAEVIGDDPLSRQGMQRWARELTQIYGEGLRSPDE